MIQADLRSQLKLHRRSQPVPDITVTDQSVEWNAYVAGHPRACLYHRFEWLSVIQNSFGHHAIPLAALSAGRIVGIMPLIEMQSWLFGHFFVSLPFLNYGGLLADSPEIASRLWEHAVGLARERGAAYVEARHRVPHPFIPQRRQHKVTMRLELASTVEGQWKAFGPKLRNQIRKAELSGLTARVGGITDLPEFYDVFAMNMRDLGTPVYSRRFFAEIFHTFPEAARMFLVQNGSTVVGAAIALAFRNTLEVPWAASRRDALALCPNNRLYWELIQHAIKAGFRVFDFGRSTPGGGTYKFKQQWGATPMPLDWEYWTPHGRELPNLSPENPKYQSAIALWRRLPLAVTNRLGPSIVRNIP
jgi:FemAB-related protein (PEP-CTERM system-associated)